MGESLEIAIMVLSDWRVIAVAVGTIILWALLRYVGSVYRRPKLPAKRRSPRVAPGAAPATGAQAVHSSEEDEGEQVE